MLQAETELGLECLCGINKLRKYIWWNLCTLHLLTSQVRGSIGDLSLCCVPVMSVKH